jgi:hypothetical protein
MRETRRTHPAYLSDDEAARDQRRVKDVVNGIMKGYEQEHRVSRQSSKRVGESENFVVEYDTDSRLVMVYKKNETAQCPFKLGFSKNEIDDIVILLIRGKRMT